MNPVEWLAWLYGKFFTNHTVLSYFLVSAVALALGVLAWTRAIDKYRSEHPPSASTENPPPKSSQHTASRTPPPSGQSPPGEESKPRFPQKEEKSSPKKKDPNIHIEQHGGPNAVTTGDNSPITINQIPPPPPARTLSQENFDRLVNELFGGKGLAVHIILLPVDEETGTFGNQIRMAFEKAGWRVSGSIGSNLGIAVVSGSGTRVFNGDGFTCSADDNAPELATALKAFEAIELKCAVRNDLPGPAPLLIYIGKRK